MDAANESAGRGAVVVGYDTSNRSEEAALWAAGEAARLDRPLVVVDVLHGPFPELVFTQMPAPVPEVVGEDAVREFHQSKLDEVAQACRRVGIDVRTHLAHGRPADVLRRVAQEAELLVVGRCGRTGLARVLLGSTAAALVHNCECPVVVVRDSGYDGRQVVVGVDGSAAGDRALGFGLDFAAKHGHALVALHAWSDMAIESLAPMESWHYNWEAVERNAQTVLAECLAGHRERYPDVPVERVVTFDSPAHALIERSRHASLLVVGSHGRGALRRALLGSVSHAVLYHAECTLVVVPDPRS